MMTTMKTKYKYTEVVNMLASDEPLPPRCKDHPLFGKWEGMRECHIEPDWLLIYKKHKDTLILLLSRTGTHPDIFSM